MVRLKRAVSLLLMTILIMTNAVTAYAGEAEGDSVIVENREAKEESLQKKKDDEPVTEDVQATSLISEKVSDESTVKVVPTDEPVIEERQFLEDKLLESILSENKILEKMPLVEKSFQEQSVTGVTNEEKAKKSHDVCFYIRGNGIGADIPDEPASYSTTEYSDAIRINGAIEDSKLAFSTDEVDGAENELLGDGFTASNAVTATISTLPSATEIKGVVDDFDPTTHYVVWYVVKNASTAGENSDVNIHVDGVIRLRQNPLQLEEEASPDVDITPEHAEKLDELESHIEFHIYPKLLGEDGRPIYEIEYDRQEHLIGGFEIVVVDTLQKDEYDEPKPILGFIFNCLGKFLTFKSYASSEDCTKFEYENEQFFLNITSAYTTVIDEIEDDITYYRGKEPVDERDITVTDIRGKSLAEKVVVHSISDNLQTGGNDFNPFALKKDKISLVIEAGTTVKNDDGSTITNAAFKLISGTLKEGHRIASVTIVGSQTGVGVSTNEITKVVIEDANGKEVTDYYNISTKNGKLQVVDPNKGSGGNAATQYTRTSVNEDNSGSYIPSTGTTGTKKTTEAINGRVARAKITHADGSVTYINVPFETSYGNDLSDNQPQVLGARRGATDDPTSDSIYRIMFMIVVAGSCIQFLRKNVISSAIS